MVIREFSLRIFYAYFEKYGFGYTKNSWMPTVFSTLPPMYRVGILEKYYNNCDKSVFVIDKLSKAYLKSGKEQKARTFLRSSYEANEITCEIYEVLDNDISSVLIMMIMKDESERERIKSCQNPIKKHCH